MNLYLVDTDWIIQVLRGDEHAASRLEELAASGLSISVITYGELYQGAYYARNQQQALEELSLMLSGIDLMTLTRPVMERFGIVRGQLSRNQRQQIGDMDLLIAATALEHGLILVTFNRRDYELVPGLSLVLPEDA